MEAARGLAILRPIRSSPCNVAEAGDEREEVRLWRVGSSPVGSWRLSSPVVELQSAATGTENWSTQLPTGKPATANYKYKERGAPVSAPLSCQFALLEVQREANPD